MAVFRRPAALAFEVAGTGWVEQNDPGDIALVFFTILAHGFCAVVGGVKSEREKHFFDYVAVDIAQDTHRKLIPHVLRVFRAFADSLQGFCGKKVPNDALDLVHQFQQVCLRILVHIFEQLVEDRPRRRALRFMLNSHLI